MPREMSIVQPPSHCTSCNTRLRPWDLIPVVSFLIQGRKCRYCGEPISWRYAIVESLTGLAFVLLYLVDGVGAALIFDALFVAALIAIFAIDLEHYIIPDELNAFAVLTGIGRDVFGLVTGRGDYALRLPVPGTQWELGVPASILGLLVGFGLFLLIGFLGSLIFKREALGGGDLKLAAGIGAQLGWLGAVASFYLAIVFGAVVGVGLIALGVKKRGEYIPFGPAMVIGALAVIYCGHWVLPALLAVYSLHPQNGMALPVRSWP